jgi:hypothetical protein
VAGAKVAAPTVTLIVSETERPTGRVWGTGGWTQPKDREALDWLTLARLLGWDVQVSTLTSFGMPHGRPPTGPGVIIFAVDPEALGEDATQLIASHLEGDFLDLHDTAERSILRAGMADLVDPDIAFGREVKRDFLRRLLCVALRNCPELPRSKRQHS